MHKSVHFASESITTCLPYSIKLSDLYKTRTRIDLWPIWDVFGAVSDEADGFHAGVWEWGIAGKLWQTLHGILEGVNCSRKVLFKYIR